MTLFMPAATSEYKDRLFSFIFGSPGNEAWTLSLYNAVNGTSYSDPSKIEINTIREALYMGMHNDVSFIIADEIDLYEQQSSYNPNMPLRMLQYVGNLYEKIIVGRKLNKYGSRLLELPVPKLVVFYNGIKEMEDEVTLELKSSFPKDSDPDISVRVRMININQGRSADVLTTCKPLMEYAWLVAQIRSHQALGMNVTLAVDTAINTMPDDFVIKGFIDQHRAEVKGMIEVEYNEAEVMELFRQDGIEEGIAIGEKKGEERGIITTLASLVHKGLLSIQDAATQANVSESTFKQMAGLN